MGKDFGWCFIGAGDITKRVMPEMHITNGGFLASVYAPTFDHAKELASEYDAKAYKSAEEAISDPNVRAVYVATPHTDHMASSIRAIKMGKPVLCEKPFTVDLNQAKSVISEAKAAGVYLVEGMWTRHNPVIIKVLDWIKEGHIGEVNFLTANMAFTSEIEPTSRLYDIKKAGGSLLDIGVYTLALARFVFEAKPEKIQSMGEFAYTGVDRACAIQISFGKQGFAQLHSSIAIDTGNEAVIHGKKGKIIIPNFPAPTKAELITNESVETYAQEIYLDGYANQFNVVIDDIRNGKLENDFVTHAFTLDIMEMMDEVRAQIGLQYLT